MKRSMYRLITFYILIILTACASSQKEQNVESDQPSKRPNVVIIFMDDAAWGDFRKEYAQVPTPHVGRLAKEGTRFNNFYVPQAICSASRAALMTGCYPGRTKVFGAHPPKARGLETNWKTMGELFKEAGYKTALFGKWHLGDQEETWPHNRGFDEHCGLMYSNDMWKFHPENPEYWGKYPLQFWENGKVTIEDVAIKEQKKLTKWYTEHAVDFINRQKDNPFFLYVPHSMPHVPIFASETFEGKSGVGLYGDVIMELDWSIGQINQALKDNGLEENTIVIYTSDNGPWASYGNHAGITPFREAKATSFDGGTRVDCIVKYPSVVQAGFVSDKTFYSIDFLPTLCGLTDVKVPDYEIDGKDILPLLKGDSSFINPHEFYAISTGGHFDGVMSGDGKWKLHLPHSYRSMTDIKGKDGMPGKYQKNEIDLSLFDMENDPYESKNVIDEFPEIAAKLQGFAEKHKEKFYGKE